METNPKNYERIKKKVIDQNIKILIYEADNGPSESRLYDLPINDEETNFLITLIEKQRAELEEAKGLLSEANYYIEKYVTDLSAYSIQVEIESFIKKQKT